MQSVRAKCCQFRLAYPSIRDHWDEMGRSMTRWDSRPVLSSSVGLTDESHIVELEPKEALDHVPRNALADEQWR